MDSESWDERYLESERLWSQEPNRFVESVAASFPPGSAIDVGCGEGRNSIWLASLGWDCVGVDFSQVALERGRRSAESAGATVDWIEADILTYEPGRTFDLVLIAYIHLPDKGRLVARTTDWVAPGGRWLLVGHDVSTAGVSGPSDPSLLWSVEGVEARLDHLEIERSGIVHRTLDDGNHAADTLVVARRPISN